MRYRVRHTELEITPAGEWNGPIWDEVESIEIKNYMGDRPEHFPRTFAKLKYDSEHLYVIFRVEDDKYIRAIEDQHQGPVWQDSCVEFFFNPGTESSQGYFGMEMNCIGKMLFYHRLNPDVPTRALGLADCEKVKILHTLSGKHEEELPGPQTWLVEYAIPLDILTRYATVNPPKAGDIWGANLYKCADECSHPHWLTWSPINFPKPNFHLPEFFGELEFC